MWAQTRTLAFTTLTFLAFALVGSLKANAAAEPPLPKESAAASADCESALSLIHQLDVSIEHLNIRLQKSAEAEITLKGSLDELAQIATELRQLRLQLTERYQVEDNIGLLVDEASQRTRRLTEYDPQSIVRRFSKPRSMENGISAINDEDLDAF